MRDAAQKLVIDYGKVTTMIKILAQKTLKMLGDRFKTSWNGA